MAAFDGQSFPSEHVAPEDQPAMEFVTSWHGHPSLHDALWYRGVNIGEMFEWNLVQEVIPLLNRLRENEE